MTASMKRVPWNKGKRGLRVAWNKGLKGFGAGHPVSQLTRDKIRNSKVGKKRPNIAGSNNYNWKGGPPKCVECDKQLKNYKAKRCHLCNNRLLFSGAGSPFWKGGKMKDYPELEQLRKSPEYRFWRVSVFTRDNYACVWCGARSGNGKAVYLEADHIKPFRDYPELRFAIDNGRTLCRDCHRKTDTYANRIKRRINRPN